MPRQPRLELPGVALHVTQRGVNRCAIFIDDEDREHFRELLCQAMSDHKIPVHAYVFMGNHIHMLVTPPERQLLSRAMRHLGQCYVRAFNRKYRRTGTLWQGRFKSCLVASEAYLMTVYRYIELNPVRAAMVERPELHPWSSIHANVGLEHDELITPHPTYLALDPDPVKRALAYQAWLLAAVSSEELKNIREHLRQERALGDTKFQVMVQKTLGQHPGVRSPGRPKRVAGDS